MSYWCFSFPFVSLQVIRRWHVRGSDGLGMQAVQGLAETGLWLWRFRQDRSVRQWHYFIYETTKLWNSLGSYWPLSRHHRTGVADFAFRTPMINTGSEQRVFLCWFDVNFLNCLTLISPFQSLFLIVGIVSIRFSAEFRFLKEKKIRLRK